jgi:hypothetical protein
MPERPLRPDELLRFLQEHNTGKVFMALKQLDNEGTEPSLHDLCLHELQGMVEGNADIIIQQGRQINVLKEEIKDLREELKAMFHP